MRNTIPKILHKKPRTSIKPSITMKYRIILIAFILLSNSELVKAQMHLGFKGGVNYVNNVIVNSPNGNNGDNQYRLGYHVGLFGEIEVKNNLSLRPEILFSNKGFKFDGQANAQPSGGGNLHLNYINLPFLVGFEIIDDLTLTFGPEVGYLISAKSKLESETIDVKSIWDNDFDFGLLAGVNYSINEKLEIEIRYIHGLSSVTGNIEITDGNGLPIDNNVKFQNRAFQLSASYKLK